MNDIIQYNNNNKWIRQGDVMLIKISDKKQLEEKKLNTKTLALGESTGHSHSFTREGDQILIYGVENEPKYLNVNSNTALLTHQEHAALEIPKGIYRIEKERTYNYWDKAVKKVVD